MKATADKQASRSVRSERQSPAVLPITPLAMDAPSVQLKRCACGGTCPRCQQPPSVQTKLVVDAAGDAYEQEADRVADQVMRMPVGDIGSVSSGANTLQRKRSTYTLDGNACAGRKTESSAHAGESVAPPDLTKGLGTGRPLDASSREFFEPRLGRDFSGVRIHSGAQASASARMIDARAYTIGNDIVFGDGQFSPASHEGRRLLAHELTHVVQATTTGGPHQPVIRRKKSELWATFNECSATQKKMIWDSVFVARRWVQRALWLVWKVLKDIPNAARSKDIEDTHDSLREQFHIGKGGKSEDVFEEVVTIYRNLYKIYNAFGTVLPFECESECPDDGRYGYIHGGFFKFLRDDNIHFCPVFFDKKAMSDHMRARGLIHEMAHRYAEIKVDVYEFREGWKSLKPSLAIENADSYATFCYYLNLFH